MMYHASMVDPHEALRRWLNPMSRKEFAEKLGVTPQAVSNWLAEEGPHRTRPNAKLRKQIEEIAGIPRTAWLNAEEREAAGLEDPEAA
jgi:transcriptional regulator with XRE-family HTH domain